MKLSDIMGYADLSQYAEIALVLFLGVFIAITIHTFWPSRANALREASLLPLEDDRVITPRHEEG
jgi:cbb3-type cytochrome oxidase subunit 3